MAPNYQNGKIYKIWSLQTNKIYIGSTTLTLSTRLGGHKRNNYCFSREIICLGDAKIELIESYPCNNRQELTAREGYYIRLYKDIIVNKNIAGRTKKEYDNLYNKNNNEKLNETMKSHYQANKEIKKAYAKEYYQKKKLEKQALQNQCE